MKKGIRFFCAALAVVCAVVMGATAMLSDRLPDTFTATEGRAFELHTDLPVLAERTGKTVAVGSGPGDTSYEAELKLLGAIPIKTVSVQTKPEQTVIPCGTPFGIKMFAEGALIVGMTEVDAEGGSVNPAMEAGLKVGDVITAIDGERVTTIQQAGTLLAQSAGKALSVTYEREGKTYTTTLCTRLSLSARDYKAGIWIKDSCAGIGTMTFVTADGVFAGLGHAICDADTGDAMPMEHGEIVPVQLIGVSKGVRGSPGEIKGYFASTESMGTLLCNCEAGVYGTLRSLPTSEPVPVAMKQEVKRGDAEILTTVEDGEPKRYSISIEKVDYDGDAPTQNMIVHITDPELLEKTGGIVQGMSGSPILQDGRLIGAVTHVFVNDPTRGYAIFAENMLSSAGTLQQDQQDAA